MATETLFPNGDDNGWPTGDWTDIDESIASADGNTYETSIDNDVTLINLDDSALVDADTITAVTVRIRAKDTGAGGKNTLAVDLEVNSTLLGEILSATLTNSYATYTITNASWDLDHSAADLDGMRLRIRANQTGKGTAADWQIDAIDVDITYTPSGNIVLIADAGSFSITGIAAGLEHHYPINANAGSYSITGIAAGLEKKSIIIASSNSYSIIGISAILINSSDIYFVELDSGQDISTLSSKTLATFTPTANKLLFISVSARADTPNIGDNVIPTIANSNGTNWVQVNTIVGDINNSRITLFRGLATSPVSGAPVISWSANQSEIEWSIHEVYNTDITGTYGSGAIVQIVTKSEVSKNFIEITLAAFADSINNAAFCTANISSTSPSPYTVTVGAGFTELIDEIAVSAGAADGLFVEYKIGEDLVVDFSLISLLDIGAIALEIKKGVNAITLNANAGSFNITGIAATFEYGYSIDALSTSYSITGINANLEQGYFIDALSTSYSITGIAANFEYGYSIDALSTSYSITGINANFEYGYSITAEIGSYSIPNNTLTILTVSGGNVVIAANQGAFNINGVNVNLEWNQIIDSNIGSYSITGINANLEQGYFIDALSTSYSITGIAATFEYGYSIDANAGNYFITGIAVNFEYGYSITAEIGSYSIPNNTLTILTVSGGNVVIAANQGAFNINGVNVNLEWNQIIDALSTSYSITGINATFEYGYSIDANASNYSITDITTNFEWNQIIDSALGIYSIIGINANLEQGYAIIANVGNYLITGVDATLIYDSSIILDANQGTYTITGIVANLEWNQIINSNIGSYSITGINANLEQGYFINALSTSYSITGINVNLEYGYSIDANVGNYLITGIDATLSITSTIIFDVNAGSYSITGINATLIKNLPFIVEKGIFTITGIDATLTPWTKIANPGIFLITGFPIPRYAPLPANEFLIDIIGFNAELLDSANPSLEGLIGTYTINGIDALLIDSTSPVLFANTGNINTIFTADIYKGSYILNELNGIDINGIAAILIDSNRIVLEANSISYSITGIDNTLLYYTRLDLDIGKFKITGIKTDAINLEIYDNVFISESLLGNINIYETSIDQIEVNIDLTGEVSLE